MKLVCYILIKFVILFSNLISDTIIACLTGSHCISLRYTTRARFKVSSPHTSPQLLFAILFVSHLIYSYIRMCWQSSVDSRFFPLPVWALLSPMSAAWPCSYEPSSFNNRLLLTSKFHCKASIESFFSSLKNFSFQLFWLDQQEFWFQLLLRCPLTPTLFGIFALILKHTFRYSTRIQNLMGNCQFSGWEVLMRDTLLTVNTPVVTQGKLKTVCSLDYAGT